MCSGGGTCQVAAQDGYTAFGWVSHLNDINFAGHNDWRMPSVTELQTILAEPYPGSPDSSLPDIDPIFGPTQQDHYWSSLTAAEDPDRAWNVHFNANRGNADNDPKAPTDLDDGNGAYVRAVRGGY